MIDNIVPYIAAPESVRAMIQESIDIYKKDDFKQIPHSELASLRRKTADVMENCVDTSGYVYLPDEVNPVALAKQFSSERQYTASDELILAVVCRAMVAPINDLYCAAAGRKNISVPFRLSIAKQRTRKQIKRIEKEYLERVESRSGCRLLRARPQCAAKSTSFNLEGG